MSDQEIKKQARVTALRLLAATAKTRKELAAKLEERGFSTNIVCVVLDRLEEDGLLSDRVYAKDLFNRYRFSKPSGQRRIAFELKRHGVPEKIREEILEQIDEASELDAARDVARGRWARTEGLETVKRKKKIYDFLIRRGFDFQVAKNVMDEMAQEDANQINDEN